MKKTNEELIQDFLDNGGKVEKLSEIEYEHKHVVNSIVKKIPVLKTLPEAELLYGRKQVKKKKIKKPDYSNIDMNLIPDHLKELLKVEKSTTEPTKEANVETDKNLRSTKVSDKS